MEEFSNIEIPPCIQKILSVCGYDNEISIENIKDSDMESIEKHINKYHRNIFDFLSCCNCDTYKSQDNFQILPGHRLFISNLSRQLALKRERLSSSTPVETSICEVEQAQNEPAYSLLLKELITNAFNNFKKMPQSRRYSEIVQDFATYIYILCGRNCYEIISSNLPMPQPSTIR